MQAHLRSFLSGLFLLIATVAVHADIADNRWQRYTTLNSSSPDATVPTITMATDLTPEIASSLLAQLQVFDTLVDQYVSPFVPLARDIAPALARQQNEANREDSLHLLVLRRRKDFLRLFRPGHFSAFTLPTLEKTVLVVGPMGRGDSLRENLFHEYVHYRLRRDVPGGLPLWFEEGLASFLSEITSAGKDSYSTGGYFVRGENQTFSLGRIRKREPGNNLQELLSRRDLEGLNRDAVFDFYRTSHALVRYLYTQTDVAPERLARALVLGKPEFPAGIGVDLKAATRALRNLRPGWQVGPFSQQAAAAADMARTLKSGGAPMTPNQTRAMIADAALLMNPKRAQRLYTDITAVEPQNLDALLGASRALRAQGKTAEASVPLAGAQQLAPAGPAVLIAQAALGTTGCIVRAQPHCRSSWVAAMTALRDALDVEPENYEAIYRLGLAHLFLGQPGEAQGYLEIAWQRVPWSPRVNFFLGESMRIAGDTRARWFLSNARRWAVSDYYRVAAGLALANLDETNTAANEGVDAATRLD